MSRRSATTTTGQNGSVDPKKKSEDKQAMLLSQDTGHFSLVKAMHLADLITEMNGFCGFMSILSSMKYCLGDRDEYTHLWLALFFMPLGLFFDFFDGKVARWRQKSSLMGQELDSLADEITFGVAPAAIAFAIGFQSTVDQLFLAFYVLCGLTRLARFNVTVAMLPKDKSGKSQYFEGTPVPFACLTVSSIMGAWAAMGWLHESIPFGTFMNGSFLEFHPIILIFALNGALMISKTLHVPKP